MSVRWFDTSTRGTHPARLAGQRSTKGSEATSGGREGEARPDGGEGYYDPPPHIEPCAKSPPKWPSALQPQGIAPTDIRGQIP